ncbi:MAG: type III secretion system inner membrane ring subunit SctD [Cocleimonas sp.]|nr:type III secretion system inner membrane ring subunit SctD [Cocleimonas sp.]
MASSKKLFSLRVLSGENIGAQITLEQKMPIVVGKSAECNVIFSNEEIADRHIKLVLVGDKIHLRPLAQPVFVEGKDIGIHDVKLIPYQLVTIGKVGFSIGDGTGRWPKVDGEGRDLDHKLNGVGKKEGAFWWGKWLFIIGVLLLVLTNLQYLNKDGKNVLALLGLQDSVEEKVNKVIAEARLSEESNLSVLKIPGGRVNVSGHVQNNEQKQRLLNHIRQIEGRVSSNIWVNADIEKDALLIAQTLGEDHVQFSSDGKGVLSAKGYLQSDADWRRLRSSILEDVEGIESINKTGVRIVLESLRAGLEAQNLSDRIQVHQKDKQFMATGNPSQEQVVTWHKIVNEISSPVQDYWKMIEDFNVLRTKAFKLALRSASVGKVPFIVSKDGKRYLEGAHLGEGYYLKKIMTDHVVVKRNDIEIPIYFGKKGGLE